MTKTFCDICGEPIEKENYGIRIPLRGKRLYYIDACEKCMEACRDALHNTISKAVADQIADRIENNVGRNYECF